MGSSAGVVAAMIGLSLIVYLRMRDTRDHSLIHED